MARSHRRRKNPSPAQMRARRLFAARARAGTLRKNPRHKRRKNPTVGGVKIPMSAWRAAAKAGVSPRQLVAQMQGAGTMRKKGGGSKKRSYRLKHMSSRHSSSTARKRKGHKRGARKGHRKVSSKALTLISAKISRLQSSLKAARKRKPGKRTKLTKKGHRKMTHSHRVALARLSALRVHRRSLRKGKKGMPKGIKVKARQYGLMRVNPSLKETGNVLVKSLPEIGVAAVTIVGAMYAGKMIGDYLRGVPMGIAGGNPDPAKALIKPDSKLAPYANAIGTAGVTGVAFAAARMVPKLQRFSIPILLGGVCAVVVQALLAASTNPTVNKLKLATGLDGYVTVEGMVMARGVPVAVEGYVTQNAGMGRYVTAGMGSMFTKPMLGQAATSTTDPFAPGIRDADWGTRHETHLSTLLSKGSTISGGMFDD